MQVCLFDDNFKPFLCLGCVTHDNFEPTCLQPNTALKSLETHFYRVSQTLGNFLPSFKISSNQGKRQVLFGAWGISCNRLFTAVRGAD